MSNQKCTSKGIPQLHGKDTQSLANSFRTIVSKLNARTSTFQFLLCKHSLSIDWWLYIQKHLTNPAHNNWQQQLTTTTRQELFDPLIATSVVAHGCEMSLSNRRWTEWKIYWSKCRIEILLASFICRISNRIQLFRQRLSYESVKAYATIPIGIMGS